MCSVVFRWVTRKDKVPSASHQRVHLNDYWFPLKRRDLCWAVLVVHLICAAWRPLSLLWGQLQCRRSRFVGLTLIFAWADRVIVWNVWANRLNTSAPATSAALHGQCGLQSACRQKPLPPSRRVEGEQQSEGVESEVSREEQLCCSWSIT